MTLPAFLLAGMLSATSLQPTVAESIRHTNCLAANIYHEARGEPPEGQELVAWVTINRVESPRYANSICDVVYQRSQFSWTRHNPPIRDSESFRRSWDIAVSVLAAHRAGEPDPSNGAIMFHSIQVSPYWTASFDRVTRIGRHIFYR